MVSVLSIAAIGRLVELGKKHGKVPRETLVEYLREFKEDEAGAVSLLKKARLPH